MNVHSYHALTITGTEKPLADYQGKVLLIVNTASKCVFTPQYAGLQDLYEQYHHRGFEVLGFPCDQFGSQEFKENSKISQFCELNYSVQFPLFSRVDVKGSHAHPLFQYLTKQAPGLLFSRTIKWNFTKFLINKQGEVVKRYAPTKTPSKIGEDIERLLSTNSMHS